MLAWIDARRCDDASTTSLNVWHLLRPAVERSLALRRRALAEKAKTAKGRDKL